MTQPTTAPRRHRAAKAPMQDTIIPIQIRSDLTVYIQGIPHDLTPVEAEKLSRVILALGGPEKGPLDDTQHKQG
jgi:hypothetical protein